METLNEPKFYQPSKNITDNANVKDYDSLYKFSVENREAFWAEQAEQLHWYNKWDKVLDACKSALLQMVFRREN